MSSNVVALPEAGRRKRNPFAGSGRHRRTPEAWAQMQIDLQAAEAQLAQMKRERDHAKDEVQELRTVMEIMREDMRNLHAEVGQMRALMAGDPNAPKVTLLPPVDNAEDTQPITAGELFADKDPMAPLRPKIRVGTIGAPNPATFDPRVTTVKPPDPSETEKVPHVAITQPIPLFDSPLAQGARAQRNTA